jgi:metal-responsive CopG/Arc/MetJ family transcriptional regulator
MVTKNWLDRFETTRTTVTLPARLVERTQAVIDRGLVPNRNAAIVAALESFLDELEEREIDNAFAAMAGDEVYRRLSAGLEEEFAEADWEALAAGEGAR